jgi:pyruvate/2-oxoglutarate dehydrogenase complex dihydrolipoamide acyltransferase (E2) component
MKKILLWITRYQGLLKKKHMGTVGVSSIGMKGDIPGWVIPLGGPVASLCIVSGIRKKPGVVNDQVVVRDFLHVTITVDHALVDGGPLARFIHRLTELVESAYGLPE